MGLMGLFQTVISGLIYFQIQTLSNVNLDKTCPFEKPAILNPLSLPFGSVRNGDYYYKEQNETKRFVSRHFKDFAVPFRLLN
jgi:hypothetical protein